MSTQQLIEQVLKRLDDLQDEAAAHIWPEDLKRCMTSECVVEVASVRMGSPDGKTVPLFSREQVAEALAAELERLERKPLTQSAVELAFKESLATHYYDFVDGVRFAERAHHIGEGEEK